MLYSPGALFDYYTEYGTAVRTYFSRTFSVFRPLLYLFLTEWQGYYDECRILADPFNFTYNYSIRIFLTLFLNSSI